MQELEWIEIGSVTRITLLITLVVGVPLSIIGLIGGVWLYGIYNGVGIFILILIGLSVASIIVVNTGIALYDIAARLLGGVWLDIKNGLIKKVDLSTFLRIALPTNLLYIGVCFGILMYFSSSPNLEPLYTAFYPIVVAIVIGSLNGIIDPLVYNLFSKAVGGIKLDIKGKRVKSVDRKAGARICGLILGFNYVFYVFIITLVSGLGIKVPALYNNASALPGYIWFFVYVGGYLVGGLVGGFIIISIYNWLTKSRDGVRLHLATVNR